MPRLVETVGLVSDASENVGVASSVQIGLIEANQKSIREAKVLNKVGKMDKPSSAIILALSESE